MRAIRSTVPEMENDLLTSMSDSEKKRRIYKTESEAFKKQELASDITRAMDIINDRSARVDFSNIEDVRQRIADYFTACSNAGVFPSVQGLAAQGFGISRQALNQWRNRSLKSNDPIRQEVERLIDRACDMMADILANQSLHNNANPVQALFQLKNNHAFADRVEIQPLEIKPPEATEYNERELMERYGIIESTAEDIETDNASDDY